MEFNRRLPRITQRDVLSSGWLDYFISRAPKRDKPRLERSRERLQKKTWGHTRAARKGARFFGYDPKRLARRSL